MMSHSFLPERPTLPFRVVGDMARWAQCLRPGAESVGERVLSEALWLRF